MSLFRPINPSDSETLLPARLPDGTNALPFVKQDTLEKVSDGTFILPWLDEQRRGWVIVKIFLDKPGPLTDELRFPILPIDIVQQALVFATHNESEAENGLRQLAAEHPNLPRRRILPHPLFPPGGWYIQAGLPENKVLLYKVPVIMTGHCGGVMSTPRTEHQAGPYLPTWPPGTWAQQYGAN